MLSDLTPEQIELLQLLINVYQSGRTSSYIIQRSLDGSWLMFGDHGPDVPITAGNLDFVALRDCGFVQMVRDEGLKAWCGKITGRGLATAKKIKKPTAPTERDRWSVWLDNELANRTWTKNDLARESGIDARTIQKVLDRDESVRMDTIDKLKQFFRTSQSHL